MKGSATSRGYGYAHQRARRLALAEMVDEQPCVRCGEPLYRWQPLDLDHADDDRSVYLGLAHQWCNRSAGAVKGNRMRGRAARSRVVPDRPKPTTSRDW